MNWRHLRTFVWLRWRLLMNHARRGGKLNAILTILIVIAALVMVLPLFFAALVTGLLATPHASPLHLMFVWDGLVVAFLFFWCIGLLTDLQRTETLSIDRLLHLPVSAREAFAINYVSSLVRLSTLVFAPILTGLALALAFTKGASMLLALPLVAALILMTTAISYQFQGWLATLMSNPRRRRAVTVMSISAFVLVCQLPQLVNVVAPWRLTAEQSQAKSQELSQLDRDLHDAKITPQEHAERSKAVRERYDVEQMEHLAQSAEYWTSIAIRLNQFLPIGWLPLGVKSLAEGSSTAALLGLTGMTLVGLASLWRAYHTTLVFYRGGYLSGRPRAVRLAAAQVRSQRPALVEWRLPGLPETVSAVALASFRSLLRAPEAKMMLLTPLLMGGIFGGALINQPGEIVAVARPFLALAGMILVLFGLLQIMSNQFGFDRDGFRVFVLSAVDRREILLGKNLAFVPFALGLAAFMLVVAQIVSPLNAWQLLAAPLQFTSMFLLFCLVVNIFSIYVPMRIAAGSLKVANPNLVTSLLQLTLFSLLFPLAILPAAAPVAIGALIDWDGRISGSPVNLALSALLCAAAVMLYHLGVGWQAKALASREQKILDTVTNRAA